MKLSPYPKYKPSDVEWLGDVPAHWVTWKATHGFRRIGSGTTPKSDDSAYYDGNIPWVTTSELRETIIAHTTREVTPAAMHEYPTLCMYPKGTLLFAMYGATIGRLGILGIAATVNQACAALAEPLHLDTWFVYYWLQMRRPTLIVLSAGGGQPNLSQDDLRQLRIPAPTLDEQRVIAEFLGRETAKIDTLVAKKRTLVERLKEKRTALISRTVTRGLPPDAARAAGLDPYPKLKPTGIDWLGDVPVHWDVAQLQRRCTIVDCMHRTVSFVEDGIPLASIREIHGFEVDLSDAKQTTEEEYLGLLEGGRRPRVGDILFSRNATVGDAAIVTTSTPFAMGQDVCLIRCDAQHPKYVLYLLRSEPIVQQLDSFMVGATFRRINVGQIRTFWGCWPPVDEQLVATNYLDRETTMLNAMVDKIETVIKRLQEYRSALITAAVTGKIDVREAVV